MAGIYRIKPKPHQVSAQVLDHPAGVGNDFGLVRLDAERLHPAQHRVVPRWRLPVHLLRAHRRCPLHLIRHLESFLKVFFQFEQQLQLLDRNPSFG